MRSEIHQADRWQGEYSGKRHNRRKGLRAGRERGGRGGEGEGAVYFKVYKEVGLAKIQEMLLRV